VARAISTGELHEAQTVPVRGEPHCLRVHRHFLAETDSRRQIAAMQLDPADFAFHGAVTILERLFSKETL
jgi:hypothetical protein